MVKVYFVTREQYDDYDAALLGQERFTDVRLDDLGIRNRKCGDGTLVTTKGKPDTDLPARFYLLTEKRVGA